MKACPQYKETLFLDVYGEMDEKADAEWKEHLKACPACQEEQRRLLELLGRLKKTMTPSPIPQGHTETLVQAIRSSLTRERKKEKGWGEVLFGRPLRVVPAMATLCVVVIAVSIFGLRTLDRPSMTQTDTDSKAWKELMAEDLEVITQLDLLTDMDWVQRLVQIIDEADGDIPISDSPENTQGMIHHEDSGTYT